MSLLLKIKLKSKDILRNLTSPKRVCNVCGRHFHGRFSPLPDFLAENVKKYGFPYNIDEAETMNYNEYFCSVCFATDRDRLYALFLKKELDPQRTYKLLDIAPQETLRNYLKAKSNIDYRSTDLFKEDVDDRGVDVSNMEIYPDNTFDVFICSHVLEHVPDDLKAMKELLRVLKPNGFGIAMVPIITSIDEIDEDPTLTDISERWRRFGQDDHVRLYSRKGYINRLRESGFKVDEYTIRDFSVREFREHQISPKSVLYIVRKLTGNTAT